MKTLKLTGILLAAQVAATLRASAGDGYGENVVDGEVVSIVSLSDFVAKLNLRWQEVDDVRDQDTQAWLKIDALWKATKDLANGLSKELNQHIADYSTLKEDFDNLNKKAVTSSGGNFVAAMRASESSWSSLGTFDKFVLKTSYNYDNAQNMIKIDNINNKLNNHAERIAALENGSSSSSVVAVAPGVLASEQNETVRASKMRHRR